MAAVERVIEECCRSTQTKSNPAAEPWRTVSGFRVEEQYRAQDQRILLDASSKDVQHWPDRAGVHRHPLRGIPDREIGNFTVGRASSWTVAYSAGVPTIAIAESTSTVEPSSAKISLRTPATGEGHSGRSSGRPNRLNSLLLYPGR